MELESNTCIAECEFGEFTYTMLHSSSDDKILGNIMLKDKPHTLYIVLGIPPVAEWVEIAKIETVLLTLSNTCCCKGDFTGYESLATTLRFVIEEDTWTAEHIVCFTVLLDDPITVELSHCVWTVWMKGGIFVLRDFLHLTVKFGSRCLIDLTSLLQMVSADCFKNTEHTYCIYIGSRPRSIETNLYVRLSCKIVDFGRLYLT